MKMSRLYLIAFLLIALTFPVYADEAPTLSLAYKITLPEIEGRMDYLAIDLKGDRLFISSSDNDSVEVIDVAIRKRIQSISNLHRPEGVAFASELNRIMIVGGDDGTCNIYDGDTYKLIKALQIGDDAEHLCYDAQASRAYVGYGEGRIALIDMKANYVEGSISLEHRTGKLLLDPTRNRIFANIASEDTVEVVDLAAKKSRARWNLKGAVDNDSLALDPEGMKLFVGCREPSKLLVLDAMTGKLEEHLTLCDGVGDLCYDREAKRIYAACGSGFLQVLGKVDGKYQSMATIATPKGARSCLWVPEKKRLYVAVPRYFERSAEIWVYER